MENFKQIPDLLSYDILTEVENLGLEYKSNQICLNATKDAPSDYHLGCGSLLYDWESAEFNDNQELLNIKKWETPLKEEDFTELCPIFEGTALGKLYNDVSLFYDVGRVRIMKLIPSKVMSWHSDDSPRLHYPFKTQQGCCMVIEDEVMHLTQDMWWWTDTTKRHTAFNASFENRFHIVVSLL